MCEFEDSADLWPASNPNFASVHFTLLPSSVFVLLPTVNRSRFLLFLGGDCVLVIKLGAQRIHSAE